MGVNSGECSSASTEQGESTAVDLTFVKGEGQYGNPRHLKMASVRPKNNREEVCRVAVAETHVFSATGSEDQKRKKRKFRPAAELWCFAIERPIRAYSFTQEEPVACTATSEYELSNYERYDEFEDTFTIVRGKPRLRACRKNKTIRNRRLLKSKHYYNVAVRHCNGQNGIAASVNKTNSVRNENVKIAVEARKKNIEKRLDAKNMRRRSRQLVQETQETNPEDQQKDVIVPGLKTLTGAPVRLSVLNDVVRQCLNANIAALDDFNKLCKKERSVRTVKKKRKVQRQRRRAYTRVKEALCMREGKLHIPDSLRNLATSGQRVKTKRVILTTLDTSHNTAIQRIQAGLNPNLTSYDVILLLKTCSIYALQGSRKTRRSEQLKIQKKLRTIAKKLACKGLRRLVVQVKSGECNSGRNRPQKPQKYELRHEDISSSADQSLQRLVDLQHRDLTPEDYELLLLLDDSVAPKTVSSKLIKDLKTVRVESSSDAPCAICFDPYEVGQIKKVLNCGHAFHVQCITLWLTNCSTACPLDGIDVTAAAPPADDQAEQQEAGLVLNPTSDSVDPAMREVAELQRRDLTPEDYDTLLRLDERVEPKTVEPTRVDGLKTQVVEKLVIGDSCAICMEHYELGQTKKILPCEHGFHVLCIENWLKNCSTLCPLDGEPLC